MGKIKVRGGIIFDAQGRQVSTHSMLKTMRRCPKQFEYKYVRRLRSRRFGGHLHRGTWIHKLLEVHSKGGDWRKEHKRWVKKYDDLFDEEKDQYGDMPGTIQHLMESYFWHYKRADRHVKVLDTEFVLEAELPDGSIFRVKIDELIEDEFGLWIRDHKTHKSLPNLDFRILDAQSADYVWVAWQNGLNVQGHEWNYVRYKAPTTPQLVYANTKNPRLSTRSIETDYPTYRAAIDEYGLDPAKYKIKLGALKAQRYERGAIQSSPFFARVIMERDPRVINAVMSEARTTARKIFTYPWGTDEVERHPSRDCSFFCDFNGLCTAELFGGDTRVMIRDGFIQGDPLDYYNEADKDWTEKGQ